MQSRCFPVWGICISSALLTILVWWLPFVYRKRQTSLALVDQPDDVQTARFNRQQMLKRVRAIWIDGVLEHSLHQVALQELGLPDLHWDLAAQLPFVLPDDLAMKADIVKLIAQRAERLLTAHATTGPTIVQFYDQAREKVLILGQPGSGKTTLLLQLASELLARAEEEERYPLPVILPLGSWRSRHTTLADWMEEELRERYHVPKDVARAWVEHLGDLLQNTGVSQVLQRRIVAPVGQWAGQIGTLFMTDLLEMMATMSQPFCTTLHLSPHDFPATIEALPEEWEQYHTSFHFYLACGKK